MSIKSEVIVNTPKQPYYPRVMVNIREGEEECKGIVVLFTGEHSGTVIESGQHSRSYPVGRQSEHWVGCSNNLHWQPCTITLTTET